MVYENCETYLNEEVRRPIKHILKDSDKLEEVMQVVDYLCEKYREMNYLANFCEDNGAKINFQEFMAYRRDKMKFVDYDKLVCPYTDEELEARLGD